MTMPSVGFLHSSAVHVPTFNELVAEATDGVDTVVVVDESLLEKARRLGPHHDEVRAGIDAAFDELERAGVTVIVCTCSTIAGAAERLGRRRDVPVIRIDRPMAEAAVAAGRRIAIVAAVESTLGPTRQLIESVASDAGRTVELSDHLCDGAWARFEAGDQDGYLAVVAATCRSLDGACDVIVLAQASMTAAAGLANVSVPILSSPALAVEAATRLA